MLNICLHQFYFAKAARVLYHHSKNKVKGKEIRGTTLNRFKTCTCIWFYVVIIMSGPSKFIHYLALILSASSLCCYFIASDVLNNKMNTDVHVQGNVHMYEYRDQNRFSIHLHSLGRKGVLKNKGYTPLDT